MLNKWFKFYGAEYLGDPKMLGFSASERSCWLNLLCFASLSEGIVKYITEERLMIQSGIDITSEEWDRTIGVFKKFLSFKMIEINGDEIVVLNWHKRQESNLTGYERLKRHREKQANVINDNAMITVDKSSIDKNTTTSTNKKPNSLLTTDKQKHTEAEWQKILRDWRNQGNHVFRGKKVVIKPADKSKWTVDINGVWEIYNSLKAK